MYDFYLGAPPKTLDEEVRFLLSAKRLLPRWCNSIPDAQFVSIIKLLHEVGEAADERKERLCLVETGAGASTLALVYFSIKHRGQSFSWDMNARKGSELRTLCNETLGISLGVGVQAHWKLIAYNTLSPHLGLGVLPQWSPRVHFSHHDSEHVWNTVEGELKLLDPLYGDGSVVCIDDSYYDFKHTDTAFLDIARKKLGLGPIAPLPDNKTLPHSQESERFLKKRWQRVEDVAGEYRRLCRNDVSIQYFGNELELRGSLGAEQVARLESRFAVWRLSSRIPGGES